MFLQAPDEIILCILRAPLKFGSEYSSHLITLRDNVSRYKTQENVVGKM